METKLFALNNSAKCGGYTHYLRICAPTTADRIPVHIIAVIDVSGSMQCFSKLRNVKKSLEAVLESMAPTDMMTLITFNTHANILAKRVTTTENNKHILKQTIDKMKAMGSTNISGGLLYAFESDGNYETPHKTSIILLTDGEANCGITCADALIDMINAQCSTDTNINTFGYGYDHNSQLLSKIATEKNGSYNVVDSLDGVASAIGGTFGSIVACYAQNVVVESNGIYSGFPKLTDSTGVRVGDIVAEGDVGLLINFQNEVRVKGYIIQGQFAPFAHVIGAADVLPADNDVQNAAYITYMRVRLAELIETIGSVGMIELEEYERLLEGNDELIRIMRTEVAELKRQINQRNGIGLLSGGSANRTIDLQHATFYRNLRSEIAVNAPPGGSDNRRGFSVLSPAARTIRNDVYSHATQQYDSTAVDDDLNNISQYEAAGNLFNPLGSILSVRSPVGNNQIDSPRN
jgi:hypothetical protein